MTDFQSSLQHYCRLTGMSEKSVFILAYPNLNRAMSSYQAWKNKGRVSIPVIDHIREKGSLMDKDGKPQSEWRKSLFEGDSYVE